MLTYKGPTDVATTCYLDATSLSVTNLKHFITR